MKKYITFAILAVLLVAMVVLGGCFAAPGATGPQGPQGVPGDTGPAGECDCDVVVSPAQLVILGNDCPYVETDIMVFGSGFDKNETITLYFMGEDNAKEVKWFKVDTNEVGAFFVNATIPTEAEFNENIFKDVTINEDTPCDGYMLTVGAFAGGSLVTTYPMLVALED